MDCTAKTLVETVSTTGSWLTMPPHQITRLALKRTEHDKAVLNSSGSQGIPTVVDYRALRLHILTHRIEELAVALFRDVNGGPSNLLRRLFRPLLTLEIGRELSNVIAVFPCNTVFNRPQFLHDFVRHRCPLPSLHCPHCYGPFQHTLIGTSSGLYGGCDVVDLSYPSSFHVRSRAGPHSTIDRP